MCSGPDDFRAAAVPAGSIRRIEKSWSKLPRPAHVYELPGKGSITKFYLEQPVRKYHKDMNWGCIVIEYSQTKRTQYGMMAGLCLGNNKLIFECCQVEEGEKNIVEVQGLSPAPDEENS